MRLWRTTKHENSQTGRKPFIFNTHSGYFHSSAFTRAWRFAVRHGLKITDFRALGV
jgi:hypothetical protein